MNYEKAYKESFEAAKGLHDAGNALTKKQMEIVFPQLAESEDERIRRCIGMALTDVDEQRFKDFGTNLKDCLAYLEKQKEQSFTHHEIDESLSDAVTHQMEDDGDVDDFVRRGIDEIAFKYAELGAKWQKEQKQYDDDPFNNPRFLDGFDVGRKVQKIFDEQKPAEWSEDWREEDIQTRFAFYTYKDEDGVLYLSNVFVEEASRNHGFGTRILRAAEKVAETIGAITICLKVKQDSPANAWYRKNGYGYVAFEDGYDWLEKNLEYLKPAKSTEWSEEDSEMMMRIINQVGGYTYFAGMDSERVVNWLKSIRPVSKESLQSWKPSEEQMKALLRVVDKARELHYSSNSGYDEYDVLRLLYKQLKEL